MLILLLVIGYFVERATVGKGQQSIVKQEVRSKARVIASLIHESLRLEPDKLPMVLQGLGRDRQLLAAYVVDKTGRVIAAYRAPRWGEPLDAKTLKPLLDEALFHEKEAEFTDGSKTHPFFSIILPLQGSGREANATRGAIRLKYDFAPALVAAHRATLIETLIDALMFIPALLVLNALHWRYVESPVRILTKTTKGLTGGDLTMRVPIKVEPRGKRGPGARAHRRNGDHRRGQTKSQDADRGDSGRDPGR